MNRIQEEAFKQFSRKAQGSMGDARRIAPYDNEDHVPYPLRSPLTAEEYAPFLDIIEPVTFTVRVPLAEIVDGNMQNFIQTAVFGDSVEISCCEFRAVGSSFEGFSETLCGSVHVQVTCSLSAIDPD